MADNYYNQQPYTPPQGGNQYPPSQPPNQSPYSGEQHYMPAQGQPNYPPPQQQQPPPPLQPTYNTYQPPHEQERDFYGSPIPPNSQLAPYQPDPRRPSSAQAGQSFYGSSRSSQAQLVPYFEPPPLRHERSSSRDSRGRHHRSSSHSHHSRPSSNKGEKSDDGSKRGLGANLVGAAGGGFLGHKLAGGGMGTVLGALVGSYAAHQAEKKHSKHRREKKKKKERVSRDPDVDLAYGSSHRRSRHGSAPPPLSGQLYPPEGGRHRRHSRSARSRSRRRSNSSTSSDSGSDDDRRRYRH